MSAPDPSARPSVGDLLADRARSHPDRPFLRFAAGDLTFAEVDERASALAAGLAATGVGSGQLVPMLMANSPEMVLTFFALARLGAVATPLNTATRGPALARALAVSQAHTAIVDAAFVPALAEAAATAGSVRRVVVLDQPEPTSRWRTPPDLEPVAFHQLATGHPPAPAAVVRDRDPALVLFTSGTTGPSKGCVLPHRYAVRQAELAVEHLGLRDDDVLYCPFPLFHIDATILTVMPALVLGATAAIGARFSASGFWGEIRAFGATVFDFMGATLTMLHQRPPVADDVDNPVRLAWGVPMPDFAADFEDRFGLRLVELYGSTDAGVPIYQPLDEPRRPGSCGRAIPGYDLRIVDDDDREVPPGTVGELVLRPAEPSLISDGYYGMAEATVAARRNLWFHTGDLLRRDDDGWFHFVGRRSDAIRRRGENISAFEVEEVVKLHPDVADAAAFGVPSPLTEEEVMVAVVPRAGATVDAAALLAFCEPHLARYALPRYLEVVDGLPRTATEKVAKHELTARGVGPHTWDREATDEGSRR
jgi:carnitine-CoA ligase